jgi:hypothetical protein
MVKPDAAVSPPPKGMKGDRIVFTRALADSILGNKHWTGQAPHSTSSQVSSQHPLAASGKTHAYRTWVMKREPEQHAG